MARKKKGQLPSGRFRKQVYIGKDASGKRMYKSITADTKADLDLAVASFRAARAAGEVEAEQEPVLSVAEAVRRYIDLKRAVLSPATIRAYEINLRKHIKADSVGLRDIDQLSAKDVQLWVSTMAEMVSPKTVRNVYTLLASSVKMFRPEWSVQVTLPQKKPTELYCPSDDDVRRLLEVIKEKELRIGVLLAAFGPLRRSEICALESSDINGNTITVSRALVLNGDGEWEVKQPKTPGSFRRVELPGFVIDEMKGIHGRIITCNPNNLSDRFRLALARSGCPEFRFHDLRHYGASIMHAIGVPDQYIMERGGWSSDHVMKRVYRNVIGAEKAKQTERINSHFEDVLTG